jgi:dihydrofolate reductase
MHTRQVILYIAMSPDGCIARDDGDINWLSMVERQDEDYGYSDFIKTVDTVIMDRKTYKKVLTCDSQFPYHGRKCYVISTTKHENGIVGVLQ